jgi:hypothetical protein
MIDTLAGLGVASLVGLICFILLLIQIFQRGRPEAEMGGPPDTGRKLKLPKGWKYRVKSERVANGIIKMYDGALLSALLPFSNRLRRRRRRGLNSVSCTPAIGNTSILFTRTRPVPFGRGPEALNLPLCLGKCNLGHATPTLSGTTS